MRALLQRVQSASVTVDGAVVGAIDKGLLVFVALHRDDTPGERPVASSRKILSARVFEDEQWENGAVGR